MPILLDLFLTFLKIGTVSFGGGYAMIPLITDECSRWLSNEQILSFIAVSESTPGPIAINMATFIGASQGGVLGAILATLGVVLPAFLIILLIASVVKGLLKFAGVKAFLSGVRPVAIGLIVGTGLLLTISVITSLKTIESTLVFDWKALVIFSLVVVVANVYKKIKKKSVSPILLIIISAFLGMLFYGLF